MIAPDGYVFKAAGDLAVHDQICLVSGPSCFVRRVVRHPRGFYVVDCDVSLHVLDGEVFKTLPPVDAAVEDNMRLASTGPGAEVCADGFG